MFCRKRSLVKVLLLLSAVCLSVAEVVVEKEKKEFKIAPNVYYGSAIGIGALIAVLGYRLLKPTAFVLAFLFGGTLFYTIAENIFKHKSYVTTASVISALVGGLAIAILVLCFIKLGIFLIGAAAGVLLAQFLTTAFLYKISPSHPNTVLYVSMALFGIVFGTITLCFERTIIIVLTSWCGALVLVRGVGYFAGHYPTPEEFAALKKVGHGKMTVSKWFWVYFAATFVLFLLAMIMQFKCTAKNVDHSKPDPEEEEYLPESGPAKDGATRLV